MTATERLYQQYLRATDEEDKAHYQGQLAAICIAACRKKGLSPPWEKHQDAGRDYWTGGYQTLAPWTYQWVGEELEREVPLKDGARYIGRRCINALIDHIREHKRRRRDAQIRLRKEDDDPTELERLRSGLLRVLADARLPDRLRIEGDRRLLRSLIDGYPRKLSNVSIARELGVTEGAVRKRRRRIAAES